MNYNRRRNIFTLGDFHQYPNPTQQIKAQHNRRQNSDPFERDPFKIQSYNFRYAERPSYPLANVCSHRAAAHTSTHQPQSSHKRFETFFYNYDFTPSVHDKENPPANKFREFRRRKFLLDHQQQNPTTASMLAQAAHSRESSSTLHYPNRQQQLHPLANDAAACYARLGTSASQTAIGATTVAAAADAGNSGGGGGGGGGCSSARTSISGSGYSGRSRGAVNHGGRYHQTLGSATDSSSVCPAAGLRSGARSTGNREYLRALATAHIGASSANQAAFPGRGRYSSRMSLEQRSRRLRAEPLGGASGARQQGNHNRNHHAFDGAHGGSAKGAEFRELSGSRTSPSKLYARQPLQSVHSASPNRVTATVEKTEGTCSGCQININIKGLDSTQLGDNVVIKIESDKNAPTKITSKIEQNTAAGNVSNAPRNDIAFAKLVEIKRNSEMNHNLDVKPKTSAHQQSPLPLRNSSSASFVIDKRLSKFAMAAADEREQRKFMPRSSSHSRVPVTLSTTRAMGFTTSSTPVRASNSSEAITRSVKSVTKERMPSMVPWCLDTTIRHGFSRDDDDGIKSLRAHPSSNLLKHSRPSYDATLNDVRKMRRQAVLAAYKPFSLQRTSTSSRKAESFSSGGGGGGGIAGAAKAGSPTAWGNEKFRKSPAVPVANWNADGVQQRRSHHSLRSKTTLNSHSNSQLELGRSPTMIMRRSNSSIRPGQSSQHAAADSQSHVTTPLNVNINVFADKLKLLRV